MNKVLSLQLDINYDTVAFSCVGDKNVLVFARLAHALSGDLIIERPNCEVMGQFQAN